MCAIEGIVADQNIHAGKGKYHTSEYITGEYTSGEYHTGEFITGEMTSNELKCANNGVRDAECEETFGNVI